MRPVEAMKFIRFEELEMAPSTTEAQPSHHDDHEENEHSWSENAWPILAFLAPVCITGFISNAVVVWIFVKWRVLRDRINLFVVNLAVSNLAICIVAPPLIGLPIFLAHKAETLDQEIVTDLMYRLSACLFGLSCYANSFATTAIALYRRRMILKSRAQMQHERPQIAVCLLMWGVSAVLSIPELFRCATSVDHDESVDEMLPTVLGPYERLAIEIARITLQFLLVSVLMIFSYVSVFFALRKRSIIRAQFQRDKSLRAHAQRLSSIQFKKPRIGLMAFASLNNHYNNHNKNNNNNCNAKNDNLSSCKSGDGQNNAKAIDRKSSRRPTLTGSCITAAAASAAATVTTVVATGSLVNGQLQSTSCDTVEYVVTTSGPAPNNADGASNRVSPSGPAPGLVSKVPSKMKHVWNSLRSKKFSASDSKNVIILIATIAVHFACWSPYNAVRLYVAIVEAIKNAEEPRAPIAEGIVLCIAVSSVLHCPLFYTWFNRRNRHGLVACCAAIIPCRNSVVRRRLKEMAHQGNSHRYRLPIPIDTPPARTPRRASRLQTALLRRHSRSGITDELRQILYNAQHRGSTSSHGPPPARHNSYNYNSEGGSANSATASDNEFDSQQPCTFGDGGSTVLVPTMESRSPTPQPSILVNREESITRQAVTLSVSQANNGECDSITEGDEGGEDANHKNEADTEKNNQSPNDRMFSSELLERAISDLARKISTPLSRSSSTRSCNKSSLAVPKLEGGKNKKELLEILLLEPSETELDTTFKNIEEEILTRTAENLQGFRLRRAHSSRQTRHRVRFDTSSTSSNNLRRHGTTVKKTPLPPPTSQFLTVPEKYGTTLAPSAKESP